MTSYLKRATSQASTSNGVVAVSGGDWSLPYPALVEFLAACTWPDGAVRIPGTLTLFTDGATWKACLSDKDQGRVAFVSAMDPSLLLLAAEEGLVRDALDWRASTLKIKGKPKN